MYREAMTVKEVRSSVEASHHLTAGLYFAVATLESSINDQTRRYLCDLKTEREIYQILRYGKLRGKKNENLVEKLRNWPEVLTGKVIALADGTLERIEFFNEVRGDLTHPKNHGRDIYKRLETVDSKAVVETVAEYIAQFHSSQGTKFPYWLWGWNYLNPSQQNHEIMLVNEQQFVFSMMYMGYQVKAGLVHESEGWQNRYMRNYIGYREVADVLNSLECCEPKFDEFPYQPKLCRLWWTPEHHKTCGFVTRKAIEHAMKEDWR